MQGIPDAALRSWAGRHNGAPVPADPASGAENRRGRFRCRRSGCKSPGDRAPNRSEPSHVPRLDWPPHGWRQIPARRRRGRQNRSWRGKPRWHSPGPSSPAGGCSRSSRAVRAHHPGRCRRCPSPARPRGVPGQSHTNRPPPRFSATQPHPPPGCTGCRA